MAGAKRAVTKKGQATAQRLYTQAEVDAIIAERTAASKLPPPLPKKEADRLRAAFKKAAEPVKVETTLYNGLIIFSAEFFVDEDGDIIDDVMDGYEHKVARKSTAREKDLASDLVKLMQDTGDDGVGDELSQAAQRHPKLLENQKKMKQLLKEVADLQDDYTFNVFRTLHG